MTAADLTTMLQDTLAEHADVVLGGDGCSCVVVRGVHLAAESLGGAA